MEFLNKHTRESIDMDFILGMILPRTPYGLQKKKDMRPFRPGEEEKLENEFDEIGCLLKIMDSHGDKIREISHVLSGIKEIRTSVARAKDGITLDEVEFFEIKNFILDAGEIFKLQEGIDLFPESSRVLKSKLLEELLDPDSLGNRTFYIYNSYSDKLSNIRDEKNRLQRNFEGEKKKLVSLVEECLGVVPKLSGEITVPKRDIDMLERARSCPWIFEETSTILTTTFRLKKNEVILKLQEEIENLKLKEEREEYTVKKVLSSEICKNSEAIYDIIDKAGRLDLLLAKAELARAVKGTRPTIHRERAIFIKNGRHLKLEYVLEKQGKKFTPLNLSLSRGVTVITGANMGGKTISMKLTGLLVTMAHFGLYVTAGELRTCLFDYVYFSIGDMQSIDSGLSTFGGEVSGMIDILKGSELSGLILIDELARGTNPEEGYAISRAIARFLKRKDSITLFTTHFSYITREEGISHLQVRGLKHVDFNDIMKKLKTGISGIDLVLEHMDYTLERVSGEYIPPRDAINIARLMGLEDEILRCAEDIMNSGKEEFYEQVES